MSQLTDYYPLTEGPFRPTWESLQQYSCPKWFRDAKFGIWAHWGPQSVPMGGSGWYARNMYIEGESDYQYHCKHYGHPSEVGFKDIINKWKAEKWDPEGLMQLYKKAGARYFCTIASHHDNFDCWNSTYHYWNSVNMGPKKDIVGTWCKVARKHGLRFGVTDHLARSYSWFNVNKGSDSEGPYVGVPYDGNNPVYQDYYFPPHEETIRKYPKNPPEWWRREWYLRIKDVVEKYHPDLLYRDAGVPFGVIGQMVIANFYNHNIMKHEGDLEGVYNLKKPLEDEKDYGVYREGIAVRDVERGVIEDIQPHPWQTDTSIGQWFYNKSVDYTGADKIIKMLVDIVSKNGNLLLDLPLRPDGMLDDEAIQIAQNIGNWLKINGEGIYGTRPWHIFGEGPTKPVGGHLTETEEYNYTPADFRFTTNGEKLYAILMCWPEERQVIVRSLTIGNEKMPVVRSVQLLGHLNSLDWKQTGEGLQITLPAEKPCCYAWVFEIMG